MITMMFVVLLASVAGLGVLNRVLSGRLDEARWKLDFAKSDLTFYKDLHGKACERILQVEKDGAAAIARYNRMFRVRTEELDTLFQACDAHMDEREAMKALIAEQDELLKFGAGVVQDAEGVIVGLTRIIDRHDAIMARLALLGVTVEDDGEEVTATVQAPEGYTMTRDEDDADPEPDFAPLGAGAAERDDDLMVPPPTAEDMIVSLLSEIALNTRPTFETISPAAFDAFMHPDADFAPELEADSPYPSDAPTLFPAEQRLAQLRADGLIS